MALVIAYLSLASIHECTNFSSNSSTRRSRFPVPLPELLDVLPLFLFRVCECRFVATPGESCARCVNVCPLDKAGEHRMDIGTDHVQRIEGNRTASLPLITRPLGLVPERISPSYRPSNCPPIEKGLG